MCSPDVGFWGALVSSSSFPQVPQRLETFLSLLIGLGRFILGDWSAQIVVMFSDLLLPLLVLTISLFQIFLMCSHFLMVNTLNNLTVFLNRQNLFKVNSIVWDKMLVILHLLK